jgi:hypothetical protein
MTDESFLRIVRQAFEPFLNALGFASDQPHIDGRLYRASFTGAHHAVFIYYEPGDDYLSVIVFTRHDGNLSNIDDRSKSPRLNDLNQRYMHLIPTGSNNENEFAFKGIVAHDRMENRLLKYAKELSLVLPKYLEEHGGA